MAATSSPLLRTAALPVPRVFAPRTVALFWAGTFALCLGSAAICFIPVPTSNAGSGIVVGPEASSILVLLSPGAQAHVRVGDAVRFTGDAQIPWRIERVEPTATAAEIERRFALPAGSVAHITNSSRVAIARIGRVAIARVGADAGSLGLREGDVIPIEVTGEPRSPASFLFASATASPTVPGTNDATQR